MFAEISLAEDHGSQTSNLCQPESSDSSINFDENPTSMTEEQLSELLDLYPEFNLGLESVPKIRVDCEPQNEYGKMNYLLNLFALLILIWQHMYNVSDRAIECLLSYIRFFFCQVADGHKNGDLKELSQSLPDTLYRCRKQVNVCTEDRFVKKVMCQKCASLRDFSECYKFDRNGKRVALKCNTENYSYGKPAGTCDADLLQTVTGKDGSVYLAPRKLYCMNSITNQIQEILARPGYEKLCQEWRDREYIPDTYYDVYDGKLWKEMQNQYGYFASDHDIALLLNFDFFQPHKNRTKSLGALYLALLNLPRPIRYNTNNLVVAGIIPSLDYMNDKGKVRHEPENIQPFVQPIVNELKELWHPGKRIETFEHPGPDGIIMHCALLGIACDSPASRKLCGFLAHSAIFGCTKCYHKFDGKVGKKTYHGFEKHCWPLRDIEKHRKHCLAIQRAPSENKRKDLESKHGCRPSALLDLQYFDIVRQNLVDPMHNLFLGNAKGFFEILVEKGILDDGKMAQIAKNLEGIHTNSSKVWLPKNIVSNWRMFNASEWKSWTTTYSLQALKGVIPPNLYDTWAQFVWACVLISKPCVTQTDLDEADLLFQGYIKSLQNAFGNEIIKPNNHMSCHLKECVEDFGPFHSFWLYAFERVNGFLGDYHTNCKGIEVTLMRKFNADRELSTKAMALPNSFYEDCNIPVKKMSAAKPSDIVQVSIQVQQLPGQVKADCSNLWTETKHIKMPKKVLKPGLKGKQLYRLDENDVSLLLCMYQSMYPDVTLTVDDIPSLVIKFDTVTIGSERLCSTSKNVANLCFVLANWSDESGNIDENDSFKRLGQIKYFFKHTVILPNDNPATHVLCAIQWYTEFTDTLPIGYSKPVQVFRNTCIKPGPASFMPVQRIDSKCAYSFTKVNGYSNCIVVSPVRFDLYVTNY